MSALQSLAQKVLTYFGARVMYAHLRVSVKKDVNDAKQDVLDKAGIIYVKTTENAKKVLDFFNTHDLTVGSDTYRYIGEVEAGEAPATGFTYQFGRLTDDEGHVSTEDVVYGDRRDYDDLTQGDTVYLDGEPETVTAVALPTKGYVNLTGFDDPLQVVEGTNYMN